MKFKIHSPFKPSGDQPTAIEKLVAGLEKKHRYQTLLGVTGSGKTFTMANVIEKVQKPTLIISHNKTLAAQLANEFQEFFPDNAVHYFVSYYDYYQPEAYIPRSDTYIEKETQINEEIDKLRNAATQSLLSRKDVLIVASVSCIYGLGNPGNYLELSLSLKVGEEIKRDKFLRRLTDLQFIRNDINLTRGTFRVRGDVIEFIPASADKVISLSFFGDELEKISEHDPLTGEEFGDRQEITIFPAKHFVTPKEKLFAAINNIRQELADQIKYFKSQGKEIEAQRIEQRTNFDLEMLLETGFVAGIENYSRQLDFRKPGEPPSTLIDYFPDDFLLFIDESHITLPQIYGMYEGDQSRKRTLIDYGFRLPSAIDNRPLKFEEFEKKIDQTIFVSATPTKDRELKVSKQVAEQLIRPTGLLDPEIEIRPTKNQIDDLMEEIQKRVKKKQRILVTTLTKNMAEELSSYLVEYGIRGQYLHADIQTLERLEILRDLRLGVYDVVVGINLLREGLDLPEVSLVAILDADKEGYLRSETSLIQTMGRAARHLEGRVIMYADRITGSMDRAMKEVERRRKIQTTYNKEHGITPTSIQKAISETRLAGKKADEEKVKQLDEMDLTKMTKQDIAYAIEELRDQMDMASRNLDFEKAAALRDQIQTIRAKTKMKKHKFK
ncbi:MAG: excinuclease ABC subunit B [Candidatus Doudnabacteria bacterium RIFCSPHIGHO2_02_FULL_42_25]|uniref:UvrABC system protein B n=1 Tax=Candidatus Doudnabacteria bacterium RIFCSPHIGHO2_01_FULL_41_86 TaxID=1817821 RepID=A0A1F5N7E5_9BACT|nr:MAG: excinuclease ABC subunit B [Candidatus Doudnabacteria bacterium RIFCSPHIGHO2_01_FULL_41_86]OGE74677.1 MAG: excinuclease ABC subunit B [Candidatus Doudnabacteria bacterium RIFCSPHIGHO2_01_43_10]OGE85036.1 MAG: excinuclease ABC subunit B [Candidatus Doudnabacteria bacterium RIFCSPHIGHO2_12_FULL_42_22]OGE86477.1 MAG: excinuclease ABC subunit B [Candidatus Doudnabacteria bacterium RIFCSPHIGHO2_02_FULL_42_25]OGE91939.1 MAG: excinuclease ABC subunit B [Candidatus Doudnabacteria bacterium RIFC